MATTPLVISARRVFNDFIDSLILNFYRFVFSYVNQNKKAERLQKALEDISCRSAGKLVVETLLNADEDAIEIAADFIEDEVGRFDWQSNWKTLKSKVNIIDKVQAYLKNYGLTANAQEIVNIIDSMSADNPGRWK